MLESPLSAAIEILSADNGVHRLNVVDGDGRVRGILSQTDIVKFLISKRSLFEDLLNSTLSDLKIGCGPVVNVNTESSVLEALEKMSENFISSVAVIETDGTLIGNISMADIRFVFQHGRYHRLWMTCGNFLSLALNQKGLEHFGNDQFPFFDAHLNSTLSQVMSKIIATKVHRVWVISPKNQHLIGLVSLTDIIGLFYEKSFKAIDEADREKELNKINGQGPDDEDY
jgi:CBS domain-containing protein